jgi:mevalonate kinase
MSLFPTYPAKVMLFGEYSILLGSAALSIPFPEYSASLRLPDKEIPEEWTESNHTLTGFIRYLTEDDQYFGKYLNLEWLTDDIKAGLYLHSTIPQHYGLGSSGALCAAVFGRYAIGEDRFTKEDLVSGFRLPASDFRYPASDLKELFSRMESYFHGRSSGYDPLVSYLQKTLMLSPGEPVQEVDIPATMQEKIPFTLVDSGIPSGTGSLVSQFLAVHAPKGITSPVGERLVDLTNRCVRTYLNDNRPAFLKALVDLSGWQFQEFRHLIPSSLHDLWNEGLETGSHVMKLCGSGGGGYFLQFSASH